MIRTLYCFALSLLLLGCSSKYKRDEQILKAVLSTKQMNICNHKCVYLIYSDKGCSACVKVTRNFVYKNIAKTSGFYCIITGVNEKEALINYTQKIISQPNFLIDTNGLCSTIAALFPKAYLVANGQIIESYEINYGNADQVFSLITKFMNEKDFSN